MTYKPKRDKRSKWYMRQKAREHKSLCIGLMGGECEECGETHPAALDFHHLEPETKSFNIAAGATRSLESIKKELSKCVLLCANCHRKEHYDNEYPSP